MGADGVYRGVHLAQLGAQCLDVGVDGAFGAFAVIVFLMTWINLAVGIVGNEDNPVNALFFAILLVGAIAAPLGRFRPLGMARAMYATAIAQGLVTAWIALAGHGYTFVLAGFFIAAWLSAAHLFRRALEDAAPQA